MDKQFLITSDLIKRGWTKALIKRFLGVPDKKAPNPVYKTKPPMGLYALERVVAIEGTAEFKHETEKVPERKVRAQKAADTKRAKMNTFIDSVVVPLPALTLEQLREKAVEHYNNRGSALSVEKAGWWRSASLESDPVFLDWISVNYLRHECTEYESQLRRIAGKTGVDEGYVKLKKKILQRIAESYPQLQDACRSQADATDDKARFNAAAKDYAKELRGLQ